MYYYNSQLQLNLSSSFLSTFVQNVSRFFLFSSFLQYRYFVFVCHWTFERLTTLNDIAFSWMCFFVHSVRCSICICMCETTMYDTTTLYPTAPPHSSSSRRRRRRCKHIPSTLCNRNVCRNGLVLFLFFHSILQFSSSTTTQPPCRYDEVCCTCVTG